MTVAVDSFGMTDIGKVRDENEDNYIIAEIQKSVSVRHSSLSAEALGSRFGSAGCHLFAVADGVGGGPEGDHASGATIKALVKYVGEAVGCFNAATENDEHQLLERLEETVKGVHDELIEDYGSAGQTPATTLTMVLLVWPRAYLVHVGDSRAYITRKGKVQQLTRDQSLGEYMMTLGAWTEDQAAQSRQGATLTSAVGGPHMDAVVGLVDLEPGDSMLLCTDGLTRHVPAERIASLLSSGSGAEDTARTLVSEALAGGGSDNVSVIVVRTETR
jgi:PPM family protein phosphatase